MCLWKTFQQPFPSQIMTILFPSSMHSEYIPDLYTFIHRFYTVINNIVG